MAGIRADNVDAYKKDMFKVMFENYDQEPTVYDQIFYVKDNATGSGDKETQLLGAGELVRHTVEGQNIRYRAPVQGWQYFVKYTTFSDGLSFTYEATKDSIKLQNMLKAVSGTWGTSVRVLEESIGARVFNKGGATTGDWVFNGTFQGEVDPYPFLAYDGKPFFALTGNARSIKGSDSITFYNSVASLDITQENFETIYNLHTATNNRDERNRPIRNAADTLLVKKGTDEFKALELMKTTGQNRSKPGSQTNDTNVYAGICDVIAWDYLDDAVAGQNAWYVGRRNSMDLQFHKRQKPDLNYFMDNDNNGSKASIMVRYGILLKNWRVFTRAGGTSTTNGDLT